jgi:rhamnosyltransferase
MNPPVASPEVVAVVVTYEPELPALEEQLRAVAPQVGAILVIDNASAVDLPAWLEALGLDNLQGRRLPDNLGVATAQNRGIEWARAQGGRYVLLLDQDSLPAPGMVAGLLGVIHEKQAAGIAVAAVGPRYQDQRRRALQPFVRVRGLSIGRVHCHDDTDVLEVDHLIASGSLIPMTTLADVGGMVDELFIDYIDTEWVLRARQRGYKAYGVCAARMRHVLGAEPIRLLGREVVARPPLRHYYMFRNAMWIYRQAWVPRLWKLADGLRLVQRFVFYALFAKPRWVQVHMMLRGVSDGLHGRMGRHAARG